MHEVLTGLAAATPPCLLIVFLHFKYHKPDPPLHHVYTFVATWVVIAVASTTSSLGVPLFWNGFAWSMLVCLLIAAWGTYWEKNVYLTLGIPHLVCALIYGGMLTWLDGKW